METLSDLIRVVNKKRISKIDVLDKTFLNSKSENLYYKLYNAIESGKISTDEEAAQLVYGTNKTDPRYKMLKSRLKDKVLKSVMLLDVDDVSNNEVIKAYYECKTHNYSIDIIVKLSGTTKQVYSLIMDNYAKALKYNFYDVLSNYSYYLMTYYSLKGERKLFEREEGRYLNYIEFERKEKYAKYLYCKVVVDFNGSTPITSNFLKYVKSDLDKMNKIKDEIKNDEVDFFFYYMCLIYHEHTNDLKKVIQVCNEANNRMNNCPHIVTNTRRLIILLYNIKALLHLKKYQKGIELLSNSDDIIIPESSYNWYITKEYNFSLYLHNNQINYSYKIFDEVYKSKSFILQAPHTIEKWKIFHAYLVFMDNYLKKGDYKFNLTKFLNDVPINSKDKSGFNFAIRIIEILFLFAHKKYNIVFAKMEALRIYRSRYLNDNTYKRNHLFLSLLLKAEKTGFDSMAMQNANWNEVELLNERNNIIADWEIIPYETLWDIFVELAKK